MAIGGQRPICFLDVRPRATLLIGYSDRTRADASLMKIQNMMIVGSFAARNYSAATGEVGSVRELVGRVSSKLEATLRLSLLFSRNLKPSSLG